MPKSTKIIMVLLGLATLLIAIKAIVAKTVSSKDVIFIGFFAIISGLEQIRKRKQLREYAVNKDLPTWCPPPWLFLVVGCFWIFWGLAVIYIGMKLFV